MIERISFIFLFFYIPALIYVIIGIVMYNFMDWKNGGVIYAGNKYHCTDRKRSKRAG